MIIRLLYKGVVSMIFEDKDGNLLMPDEADELSPWEIYEKGIHVYSKKALA